MKLFFTLSPQRDYLPLRPLLIKFHGSWTSRETFSQWDCVGHEILPLYCTPRETAIAVGGKHQNAFWIIKPANRAGKQL